MVTSPRKRIRSTHELIGICFSNLTSNIGINLCNLKGKLYHHLHLDQTQTLIIFNKNTPILFYKNIFFFADIHYKNTNIIN